MSLSLSMPPSFPDALFRAFVDCASEFFPGVLTDEYCADPLNRRQNFDFAWSAVRYRYRSCSEGNEEFKALFANARDMFREGFGEEENYMLNRTLYEFFMSGVSVFESLGFFLYFVGNSLRPDEFPHVRNPQSITLTATVKTYAAAFPGAPLTDDLRRLTRKAEFTKINAVRNILAHRLVGTRYCRSYSDGVSTPIKEEFWHISGSENLPFDERLTQNHLDDITGILTAIVSAALELCNAEGRRKSSSEHC